jgi:hypothetical protein
LQAPGSLAVKAKWNIAVEKKLNGHSSNGKNGAILGDPRSLGHERSSSGESAPDSDEEAEKAPDVLDVAPVREVAPPPAVIAELAESCVRYVQRSLGVALDYTAETLPLLDHYLAEAQKALVQQSEADPKAAATTLPLLVHTAGAYFGEVVRRRYASWWRAEGSDPMSFRIELETAYLAFSPMLFIYEALARSLTLHGDQEVFDAAQIEMDEEDQKAASARLAELEVSDDEYYAPSTRLEAIDVVVDTIRTRRLAAGDPVEMALTPEDYET